MKIKLSSNNVFQYLVDIGLCEKQDIELTNIIPKSSQSGRQNLIFLTINLPSVGQIFIKQSHYDNNINNIIKKEWLFQSFLQSSPNLNYICSLNLQILHFDKINSIIIYKCPPNYIDLESYYRNHKNFSPTIAELVGTTLAALHCKTLNSHNCYDFMNKVVEGKVYYQFPHPSYLLDQLEPETLLKELHLGGNSFLYFYQRDKNLKGTVTDLVVNHNRFCLTHNNFKLDNILIFNQWQEILEQTNSDNNNQAFIRINNWEKCSWGDPAFDVGTVIADYLLLWLNSLILHSEIKLEKSLQLARMPLGTIQPSIVALTRSYINKFPKCLKEYPNFLNRVIQFTGLALIYKITTMIQSFQNFNFHMIYILKVATNLLCQPEKSFMSVFGMTELAFIESITLSTFK
jgi:hypothetical protein